MEVEVFIVGPIFISTSNNSYGEAISTTSIRKMIKDIIHKNETVLPNTKEMEVLKENFL